MSCPLHVARSIKRDILNLPHDIHQEIGSDLLSLEDNPLPADRRDLSPGAYFHQLACGYFVSWELVGAQQDILELYRGMPCRNLTIRVLGVAAESPK